MSHTNSFIEQHKSNIFLSQSSTGQITACRVLTKLQISALGSKQFTNMHKYTLYDQICLCIVHKINTIMLNFYQFKIILHFT